MRASVPLAALLAAAAAGCDGPRVDSRAALQPIPAYDLPSCTPDPSPLATTLLVGVASDGAAAHPGIHLTYRYVAGVHAPGADCLAAGRASAVGCGTAWWGTWQYDQDPPGAFVRGFVADAEAAGLVPMLSYYTVLQASGVAEGAPEVTQAATSAAFLRRYLNDFRFLLRQIGCRRALVHVEPDFWGYAQHEARRVGGGAAALAAPVRTANPVDCADQPDTIAGLGRCLVAMVRRWAPNARVGLHASAWASGYDCILNRDASLDVAARARETADFLDPAGAASSDFVVVDIADRDAGWRQSQGQDTWIGTTTTLPSYTQAFAWSRALADRAGKPLVWWQVPVGNMSLPDHPGAWKDNKVEYFFAHPADVAASGAIAMAFGAGATGQTTPDTDGGLLWSLAAALRTAGGQPLP